MQSKVKDGQFKKMWFSSVKISHRSFFVFISKLIKAILKLLFYVHSHLKKFKEAKPHECTFCISPPTTCRLFLVHAGTNTTLFIRIKTHTQKKTPHLTSSFHFIILKDVHKVSSRFRLNKTKLHFFVLSCSLNISPDKSQTPPGWP